MIITIPDYYDTYHDTCLTVRASVTKTEALMLPLSLHYFCCAVNDFAENSVPGSSSLHEASHTLSRSDTEHGTAQA